MSSEQLFSPYDSGKVWKMCLTASLGSFIFGYNLGVFTSIHDPVASTLDWGSDKDTWITVMSAIMPFGAMISAVFSGPISNRIGRRRTLMLSNFVTLLGAGIIVIPFTVTFGIGRFITGIGAGSYAALVPLYINETSPTEISGKTGAMVQFQITLGIVVAYLLALVLPTGDYDSDPLTYWWMGMFALQGPIAMLQFFLFFWAYKLETPTWFWSKNFREDALESLRQVYSEESAQEALKRLDSVQNQDKELTSSFISEAGNDPSYMELLLCKQGTGKLMRLGWANNFFQQFSGINAILAYSTAIFGHLGGGTFMSRVYTVIVGTVNMVSALAVIPLVDKLGRKILLVLGCIGMGGCLFLSGLFSGPLSSWSIAFPMISILLYIVFFEGTIGPICWIYCGEIMSPRGMSICTAVNWLCVTIVIFTFPPLKDLLGISVVFWCYAAICAVGVLYFWLDMLETRGLNKQEIQKLFMKKSS